MMINNAQLDLAMLAQTHIEAFILTGRKLNINKCRAVLYELEEQIEKDAEAMAARQEA